MVNSCRPGPLGLNDCWIWPRMPGSIGVNDQSDPNMCKLLGHTPGSLGVNLGQGYVGGMVYRAGEGVPMSLASADAAGGGARTGSQTITLEALKLVAPRADDELLRKIAFELNQDLVTCGLDSPLRRAHFFAQVLEEAGPDLEGQVENLNYSPEALKSKFSYYKKTENADQATTDGYEKDAKTQKITRKADQKIIANKIYSNRIGNGSEASGDGWLFRGRGFIQVTGRANYKAVTARYKKLYPGSSMDFETAPEKLAEFPYGLRSAVCFWIGNNLHTLADVGSVGADVDTITAVVNKHTKSYAERRNHFTAAWAAFK